MAAEQGDVPYVPGVKYAGDSDIWEPFPEDEALFNIASRCFAETEFHDF